MRVEVIAEPRTLDIARRHADLAIRMMRPRYAKLLCRKLGDYGFALYASRGYLAAHGVPDYQTGVAGHASVSYAGAPAWFSESLAGSRAVLVSNSPFVR